MKKKYSRKFIKINLFHKILYWKDLYYTCQNKTVTLNTNDVCLFPKYVLYTSLLIYYKIYN